MKTRREFITLLGGVASAWPLAAPAQQAMPVVGFLDTRSSEAMTDRLRAWRQGLQDTGHVATTIPIVFAVPEDPVGVGLVASLARPGGNLTGVNFFTTEPLVLVACIRLRREA